MKIVINSCFGGFSLSPLATKRLAKLNGRKCYFFVMSKDKLEPVKLEEADKAFVWYAYDIPNPNKVLLSAENWHEMSFEERKAANDAADAADKHNINSRTIDRNDPKLIQVIEELGVKANGKYAKLTIVEIPDDVEWTIEEYNGNEHVAEVHRVWR